ncbi:MAG: type II toxin-antitoxin system RelE/ParE family toxin [Flavobacteriaceae bacterium]|nr:type II toxin-antitoxin system RelE/ParE family toxin [Flavobacteriaceae bacterium]
MRIFWTEKAVSQHKELEKYLLQNWTQKELENYTEKLSKIIELLSKFPETGVLINGLYRKMNVTKHTALIYRIVNGELVVLLMVWDNRSKPIW